MDITLESVQAQAMQLSADEREQLAEWLVASFDDEAQIEAAWEREIERRVAELDAGIAQTVPVEDVIAELRARYPG